MTSVDLASARKRAVARHAQRRRNERASTDSLTGKQEATSPFQRIGISIAGAWNVINGPDGTRPAARVRQVDSELLDQELLSLLQGQVGEALKYFRPRLQDDWSAELSLCLQIVLYKFTIWDHNASYGAALQGLRYADARGGSHARKPPTAWQKGLYGLITIGGNYAWTKWTDWLIEKEGGYDEPSPRTKLLSKLTDIASTAHSTAALASFLVFLIHGRYRTLVDRLLRLRLMSGASQMRNEVSFEYLNRQLVWHAFTEFLLFVLPLVGIRRWRRWLVRAWQAFISFATGRHHGDDAGHPAPTGEYAHLPERTCAICYQDQVVAGSPEDVQKMSATASGVVGSAQTDITMPYETIPCACVYCYVCIAQRLQLEDGAAWTCLRCGTEVRECRPWKGGLLEEEAEVLHNAEDYLVEKGEEDGGPAVPLMEKLPIAEED